MCVCVCFSVPPGLSRWWTADMLHTALQTRPDNRAHSKGHHLCTHTESKPMHTIIHHFGWNACILCINVSYLLMYSPVNTLAQALHLKQPKCHWLSRANRAWPFLISLPQPAQPETHTQKNSSDTQTNSIDAFSCKKIFEFWSFTQTTQFGPLFFLCKDMQTIFKTWSLCHESVFCEHNFGI